MKVLTTIKIIKSFSYSKEQKSEKFSDFKTNLFTWCQCYQKEIWISDPSLPQFHRNFVPELIYLTVYETIKDFPTNLNDLII